MKYILVKDEITNNCGNICIMVLILAAIAVILLFIFKKEDYQNTLIKEKFWFPKSEINYVNQHKWETKLPVLVGHRYNYNDYTPNKSIYDNVQVLTDKARLKELPLNLKNLYHARIDPNMYNTDYYLVDY